MSTFMRWDDAMNAHDSEEHDDEVNDMPSFHHGSGAKGDRVIRRRSSKACDNCRKSKCKCERTGDNQPCRSCVVLGTECTFLGPSRKRGPPKGYIDAIESRLHQLEALLGIIISANDPRTQSIIEDLSQDTLARDIISRVDNSPFGPRGRRLAVSTSRETYLDSTDGQPSSSTMSASRSKRHVASRYALDMPVDGSIPAFITPSNEWQDHLASRIAANGRARQSALPPLQVDLGSFAPAYTDPVTAATDRSAPPSASVTAERSLASLRTSDLSGSSATPSPRRTRRRTDGWGGSASPPSASVEPILESTYPSSSDSEGDGELLGAIGQLSLDDHEQVRFHGKASGLQFLGKGVRRDKRIENGIWRFPPARVWPPALGHVTRTEEEVAARARLPSAEVQQHLIELYFTYIHPVLPVLCKDKFTEAFNARGESPPVEDAQSPESIQTTSSQRSSQKAPTLLLLSMFALSSRFTNRECPIPGDGSMWEAGDTYLDDAKTILNQVYASSRPTTCQALLLLAFREIGIGAMAQAWLYVGMAIRMAQDLGLHRYVDKWQRSGMRLFTQDEMQLRRRIWHTCIVMDRYVSTYIGRPLAIDEREFDTPLPTEIEQEENELWENHPSLFEQELRPLWNKDEYRPIASRSISTFNAAASLASIVGLIVQSLYSVKHGVASPAATANELEKKLDMWWIELPDHLRYDPSVKRLPIPPPNILTLHMNHWTAVLLLHRPFINMKPVDGSEDPVSAKAWDLCVSAASHISTLVGVYRENFCLKRCAPFLSYYIFSAGIMHVTTLTKYPQNVQANLGLQLCMDALKYMDIVWPSAGRAWELLNGANVEIRAAELAALANTQRSKRAATSDLVDTDDGYKTASTTMSGLPAPVQIPAATIQSQIVQQLVAPSSTYTTLTPTTATSSDSFFGPYMRWSQNDMFHPGAGPSPAPTPAPGYPMHGHAHQHHHHHHAHQNSHQHPHSHSRTSSLLGGYTQPTSTPQPPQQQQQDVNSTRYAFFSNFGAQDGTAYNDPAPQSHQSQMSSNGLFTHPQTAMLQPQRNIPLNAPLGTAPAPANMTPQPFNFTPFANTNGAMMFGQPGHRMANGIEGHAHHE